MQRQQIDRIKADLARKMVFLTGPRQVGKTWLAQQIRQSEPHSLYLNYDALPDRKIIQNQGWLPETQLLVLDELHKMPGWKNHLKGIYDTRLPHQRILVTGSARLETFRQTGDSLAGRFFRHRLNPFTLSELPSPEKEDFVRLIQQGGFPEPFLAATEDDANRWRMQYIDSLIRIDILDFEKIHDFRSIQLTLELLRDRVASPLSYTSLAEDVGCSPNTIRRYIDIFEALHIVFRVYPWSRDMSRAWSKTSKVYFYDNGLVKGDDGVKYENIVAVSLLAHLNAIEDQKGRKATLHFLRTKEKKEVDFFLDIEGRQPLMMETKLSDDSISPSLRYFFRRYEFSAIQLVKNLRTERFEQGIEVRRAFDFLRNLPSKVIP